MSRSFSGAEQGNLRPRPKSDFFITPRASSTHYIRATGGSSRIPSYASSEKGHYAKNHPKARPPSLQHIYTLYALPSMKPEGAGVETTERIELPLLTSKDLVNYFNEFNDLRNLPDTRSIPEQYRYIYPPSLLNPLDLCALRAHLLEPSIYQHWLRWMNQINELINGWEKAVFMMRKAVETYLELPETKKQAFGRIDDLNSSSTQGVNQFVELHLNRAVDITKASNTVHGMRDVQKLDPLGSEFESWKIKYESLHEERRKWTRVKLGYRF
ncbi:hypothetical protein BDZ91DRAFT_711815 [Kalaharituber pfeilii]|nr:hypothetical protein BDZ91DRAFT_711815 [Kalaharituber pfeilii]